MYLDRALVLNSGAIARLNLKAGFSSSGSPKPLILVGKNGSGKTAFLSLIADAFFEFAAQHFQNVGQTTGLNRKYFRILGGRTQRLAQAFELSALRFSDPGGNLFYRAKSGRLSPSTIAADLAEFQPISDFPEDGNDKSVRAPAEQVERVFGKGVYAFFPASRFEVPYWANSAVLDRSVEGTFDLNFSTKLEKALLVQSAMQELKPWLLDVVLDISTDPVGIIQSSTLDEARRRASASLQGFQAYANINHVLSKILGEPDARLVRLNRSHRANRLCIARGREITVPSLDHLSAGQATLFAIFGTILRYADLGDPLVGLSDIEGCVLVDEVDQHLHSDLQHDALPELIKLFPKVQFIVTAHSPLLPLGMRRLFSDEGFSLIEMPTGVTIDAERFTEFANSLEYFRATQRFEDQVRTRLQQGERPLVLFEGETDPKYVRAAAEILGFAELASSVDFDWVGQKSSHGAVGGGKSNLNDALKLLKYNPQFVTRRTVLLYDSDTGKVPEDHGDLHVRTLPTNARNLKRRTGIENLLPEDVFSGEFFETKPIRSGDDEGEIKLLKKVELCEHLCQRVRNADHFAAFRPVLEELERLLISP